MPNWTEGKIKIESKKSRAVKEIRTQQCKKNKQMIFTRDNVGSSRR